MDRNLITRSTTIPSTFEKSKSVSEIVNFKDHVHHSDWRYITLDIPAQHDVPDEVLLAKFVKGFFGGAVLRPERLTLQMLGIELVHFSSTYNTIVSYQKLTPYRSRENNSSMVPERHPGDQVTSR